MYHALHLEFQLQDLLLRKLQSKREKIRTQKRETKKIIKDSSESFFVVIKGVDGYIVFIILNKKGLASVILEYKKI